MSRRVHIPGPGIPKIVLYLTTHVFPHVCGTCLVWLFPAHLKTVFSFVKFGSTFSLFFRFWQTTFCVLGIRQHFSFKDGIVSYTGIFFCNFKRFWLEAKVDMCPVQFDPLSFTLG